PGALGSQKPRRPGVATADLLVRRVSHPHHAEEVVALVLPDRRGGRLEEQRTTTDDRLHAANVLRYEPQRGRVLVHDVVEEVTARALLVEAPDVSLGLERVLERRAGVG